VFVLMQRPLARAWARAKQRRGSESRRKWRLSWRLVPVISWRVHALLAVVDCELHTSNCWKCLRLRLPTASPRPMPRKMLQCGL
jgi:hypothetical protein